MGHRVCSAVIVASCLAAAACQQDAALTDQDRFAIQKAHDEFERMITAEKPDPVALVKMYYADNARFRPPHMPPAVGQAAIVQDFKTMGQARTFRNGPLTIEGRGGTAYVEATWEGTFVPPGSREPVAAKGTFIEVWQKQPDGRWKASRDIWNIEKPPPRLALPAGILNADASSGMTTLDGLAGTWAHEAETWTLSPLGPAEKWSG
jgi:ketosteroid isomerase-like protein